MRLLSLTSMVPLIYFYWITELIISKMYRMHHNPYHSRETEKDNVAHEHMLLL